MTDTHCQICGRLIQAKNGRIAHHGYQRPGHGWQTASCPGAKYRPYEVACERLEWFVNLLIDMHATKAANLVAVEREELPVSWSYEKRRRDAWSQRETVQVVVTRDTWEQVKAEHSGVLISYGYYDFDRLKAVDVRRRNQELEGILTEIKLQTQRLADWRAPAEEVA
jgi:hypothetical protein